MKNLLFAGFLLLIISGISCNGQPDNKQIASSVTDNGVDIYYFHTKIRCVTCIAIEAETRKNIDMFYPEQSKSGKISFTALDITSPEGKAFGERLGVNTQALLIVNGDQKINITSEGFLYAVSKPDKFSEILKGKIDPLLK